MKMKEKPQEENNLQMYHVVLYEKQIIILPAD